MKKDLGIILLELDNHGIYDHILNTAKQIIDHNPYNQICIFNSKNSRIDNMNIPIFHIAQAKFFDGNLLIFDTTALLLAKYFPNIDKILMYATDTFWNNNPSSYSYNKSLFETKNLEFIAQNQELYDLYTICWKKPLKICEELKYDTIKEII